GEGGGGSAARAGGGRGEKGDEKPALHYGEAPAGGANPPPIYGSGLTQAAASGLDRPRDARVNVFFALTRCPTYQCRAVAGSSKRQRRAMVKPSRSETPSLAELRREIDRIDEAMHGLLMERGEIIDRLIATQQTQATGSAFRPAREAEMMRQ